MSKTPRGIRNNNPGNIERTREKWVGMAADQSADDRFIVFSAPVYGIRALAKILINYQRKYGIRTIYEAVSRWAPKHENDTGAYAKAVAKAVGVDPDAVVDFDDPRIITPLVTAIIRHENGQQPYDQDLIEDGIRMARG